ncbi:DUF6441 family protein [Sagittula stellata]|uniref:Uncharacterized protein n=1 Tax=Sagittula stellata (strain ATCC 700073 / DSM 11524 / E-37) TaxID=388399 RepID=A3K200_SAGS3|nr:DUF6441 family protein [Sagittula stellata]EBA08946.1 hypothetical protein SSE37_04850 [Sagittula stellata E-37]
MRLTVRPDVDVGEMMARDLERMERAHMGAMRSVARDLKSAWRQDIAAGGLGNRLGNTVRSESYPQGTNSLNAAALVWTKAPEIVAAHDEGATIGSRDGFWLAIPLEAAGRGRFGRRMTPLDFERRTGQRLRFVYRQNRRSALLVVDDARLTKRGQARRKGGRRRKDGVLTGAQTVPVFLLVPQVTLRKRTDLVPAAEAVTDRIPGLLAGWLEG